MPCEQVNAADRLPAMRGENKPSQPPRRGGSPASCEPENRIAEGARSGPQRRMAKLCPSCKLDLSIYAELTSCPSCGETLQNSATEAGLATGGPQTVGYAKPKGLPEPRLPDVQKPTRFCTACYSAWTPSTWAQSFAVIDWLWWAFQRLVLLGVVIGALFLSSQAALGTNILLGMLFVVGVSVYDFWNRFGRRPCPCCGSRDVIPAASPRAKRILGGD